nr:toxic 8-peptide [Lophyrotoma interrupta]
AFVIDDEQ